MCLELRRRTPAVVYPGAALCTLGSVHCGCVAWFMRPNCAAGFSGLQGCCAVACCLILSPVLTDSAQLSTSDSSLSTQQSLRG